jgi:hypothetical protein
MWISSRVTRCAREKWAQNVTKSSICQNECIIFAVLKGSPKFWAATVILKQTAPFPTGKNSPNLVTLISSEASF